jgi:hypothetical protein
MVVVACRRNRRALRFGARLGAGFPHAECSNIERYFHRPAFVCPMARSVLRKLYERGYERPPMSEFVNYNKRSINLPPGCKDLIDVLPPKAFAEATRPLGVTMFDVETATISSIQKYIEKFLQSRQMLLLIYTPDEQVSFGLTRFPDNPITASVDFVENPVRYESLRRLFAGCGLQIPTSTPTPPEFISGAPVWANYEIHPFSSDTARLVEIATAIFRELCGAADTPLQFLSFSTQ